MKDHYDKQAYNPEFHWHFLHPKYWGTWLAVAVASLLCLLPHRVRRTIATGFAKLAMKFDSKSNRRARVNLAMCFPDKSEAEREAMLMESYITAGSFLMGFASLSVRSRAWLESHTIIRGEEHLATLKEQGESAILLVPHTWAIDIPAVLLASRGLPVSAMAKKQKNEVSDWLMHKQRVQYGGRVYERSGGIKPFIKSIREGYLGYYLPDEDLGPEHSVFVDFFATTKATISGLGRLAKLSRSKIVPLYSVYNSKTGQYEIDIYPPLSPFPLETEEQDARLMNECIEQYVTERPEQYMWILRLLKTRPNGEANPYNVKK
ncbi:lauroyl-Kdo(2)-lipid IV(A) myristoyltransferase [Photobacterium ganghwense]|uniref:Lipid A biosynthesis acyltransferase n=1 Tax=Photobacterium ganghwense TaxID=320778 RepID=A0A0J1JTU7_9GAMM|nr:lauroyl-Kdo(2)-lipid IV(A) myristoyltransferase [Photobacterium ganghwense]KLV05687.1 lauroyl acyltransferase [Photobacterium ganghwense]MBV1841861.1 lauroyl-Kdo(2)-lipid IV(A) myristoyltransferase [Photobacterium ganghwense]PSU06222.1 lauroyl-Kdo(2)-lipid IV(A) myristoyltransferase [Photobacterium ganghwense]QSV14248.1 lauroyl-Kdo(2)-lipid IV(A) myristoyltransferase [Photobacterium ganghwense]